MHFLSPEEDSLSNCGSQQRLVSGSPLQKGHDCPIKFSYALRSCWLASLCAYCCFVYTHCKQNSMATVGKSIGHPTILRTHAKVYAENQFHKLFSDLHNSIMVYVHAHTNTHTISYTQTKPIIVN